jgi:hypothetical protein
VLDEDAAAPGPELAALAVLLPGGLKGPRPFLADPDQDHPLAIPLAGTLKVGLDQVLLVLAPLELQHRDLVIGGELLDGGHVAAGDLAQHLVARDLLAQVPGQEPGQILGLLEPGQVGVAEDAIDHLVLEHDVLVE